jgi:hypothetical protein
MASSTRVLSVLHASASTGSARHVLLTAALLADEDGTLHIDEYYLAELCLLPPMAVVRSLMSLEASSDVAIVPVAGNAWQLRILRGDWLPALAPNTRWDGPTTYGHAPPEPIHYHAEVIARAAS